MLVEGGLDVDQRRRFQLAAGEVNTLRNEVKAGGDGAQPVRERQHIAGQEGVEGLAYVVLERVPGETGEGVGLENDPVEFADQHGQVDAVFGIQGARLERGQFLPAAPEPVRTC